MSVRTMPQSAKKGSTRYGRDDWRPAGSLPLKVHQELGRRLCDVDSIVAAHPSAHKPISRLRMRLEDWLNAETNGQLCPSIFFYVYVQRPERDDEFWARTRRGWPDKALKAEALHMLGWVRSVLTSGYPAGHALDGALKLLDRTASALNRMKTSN
ncbi:MAG: DUF5623 domain-containing protein [Pseudomonadota bacterium]